MMSKRIKYYISKFKYDTFPQFLLDILKALHIWIDPFYIFREGTEFAPSELKSRKIDEINIGFAKREHLPLFLHFTDRPALRKKLNERFDNGDICLAAWEDGKIIGFTWADLKEFSFKTYRFPLQENEAYLYDAYTSPEYRGKRIADYLRYQLYLVLAEQGRNTLYSMTMRFNPPALRFKRYLGAPVVDSGILFNVFGLLKFGTSAHPDKLRAPVPRR
ncbi:GNAT family N-acetyltransferase [candidate division KSB1 bacterium]|nr:GNAT family N-acetyltransferase [candidate division KSB1 bacterium]